MTWEDTTNELTCQESSIKGSPTLACSFDIFLLFLNIKLTLYLTLVFSAMIMMATAAPSNKACYTLTEPHANAVCKSHCGDAGYMLGECGDQGICMCQSE